MFSDPNFMANFLTLLSKISFLVIDLLFTLFLIVVFRQVLSMNTIVNDRSDANILKIFAFLLIILSLSLFLTGIVIL